ncbi:MAG: class I SAM-dependent methyltransferase [Alphaproteobacteria bacterium]
MAGVSLAEQIVTVEDFAAMFCVSISFTREALGNDLPDLRYRRLGSLERDVVLFKALQQLEDDTLRPVTGQDRDRWETGWNEILERVNREGVSVDTLRPQYYKHDILRYFGDYIRVLRSPNFASEMGWLILRMAWRLRLAGAPRLLEIGCGTGVNLFRLGKLDRTVELVGCDWAAASQELLGRIARDTGLRLRGLPFNMLTLEGGADLPIDGDTAVFTVHALEQLGPDIEGIITFLLEAGPRICVHIEPIVEFYRPWDLLDELAVRYHRRRNYLTGLIPLLERFQTEGRLKIVDARRIRFGTTFHETFSVVVWRPLPVLPTPRLFAAREESRGQ